MYITALNPDKKSSNLLTRHTNKCFLLAGGSNIGRISQLNFRPGPRISVERFEGGGQADEGGRGHHRAVQS